MIDNQKTLYKFSKTNNNVNWPSISYKYKLEYYCEKNSTEC